MLTIYTDIARGLSVVAFVLLAPLWWTFTDSVSALALSLPLMFAWTAAATAIHHMLGGVP